MLPTERTLIYLRRRGLWAAVVERWNAHAGPIRNGKPVGIRQDLWGVFDVLAFPKALDLFTVKADPVGILAVQATSDNGGHLANRVQKIVKSAVARDWILGGNRIEVHAWKGVGKAKEKKRWKLRIRAVTLEDFR